jgi:exopolyphosphatase / guanosine-5'-triphosphate,3'-diphosphate pyrophosphatase
VPDSPADAGTTIPPVRVAIVDVGSNSVRLLIASVKRGGSVREIARDRVYLRLGDDAYRFGRIGRRKLDKLAVFADRYARRARAARVDRIETIVTAPGRQSANSEELVELLEDVTRASVVLLSADDEGRLAWEGAVAFAEDVPTLVGVVDLGGGSCEVAVGNSADGPTWVQSRDAGALRVTRELLPAGRPPSRRDLAAARHDVRERLNGVDPPRPELALAVGGTARAVGRIVGARFSARKLDALAERLVRDGPIEVCSHAGITQSRAETLLGGTLVLSEVARRLDSKLEVGIGGLREGAALSLARAHAAAA